VSLEAKEAGEKAVEYINESEHIKIDRIEIKAEDGVRYVVPEFILKNNDASEMTLKMRVGNVYRRTKIVVEADGEIIHSKPKQIVTPGEMETIPLKSDEVLKLRNAKEIKVYLRSV